MSRGTSTAETLALFPEAWSRQCVATPNRCAIVSEDFEWTYKELDRQANAIAQKLLALGVSHGSRVGLCVDRSPEAIASMIGVMKLGAVFVPLDPEFPVDRLCFMVSDADISTVIGHVCYRESIGKRLYPTDVTAPIQWMNCEPSQSNETYEFEPPNIAANDLAYIMYTSGSTGKPKGVQIEHLALATYLDADIDCFGLTENDRTLQFSTLCFDIAIEEIFPPLLSGGCVVVRPRGRADNSNELSTLIARFSITSVHIAAAYWHQWVDLMVAAKQRVPAALRLIIPTGEKCSVEHYRRWLTLIDREVLFCNAYGPTETTVTATVFIPDENFDSPNMPIGKPLKHYTAHILNDNLQPVDEGETGQLFIGGPALARGYLNRPELTEAAFLNVSIDGEALRIYRTGDLARWLPDGNIDFAGRIDHQIKLGSYRIEPGEIEAAIDKAPGVLSSLATFDEVDGQKYLVAYVAHGTNPVSAIDISKFLRSELPPYMIPARFVFIESFPKTINGKIDRKALPAPSTGVVPRDENYVAPRNALEQQLVLLWQEVLNVPEVGIHDDFFLLGGSSLLVTQIVARLTLDMEIELPVRDFFANPTIATLSRQLRQLTGEVDTAQSDEDIRSLRDRLPIAEPRFFTSGEKAIYSVHYRPRSGSLGRGVVMCHALGHEYARGYRNLQQLAIALCNEGFDVLRFDYAGTGNSDGGCGDLTCETMHRNLLDARQFLLSQTSIQSVSVIGLRLGGTIASSVTAEDFDQVVLWDPVVYGSEMLAMFDRFHDQQLTGLRRFSQIRSKSNIDQSYGHEMSDKKRQSLAKIKAATSHSNLTVVLTEGSLTSAKEQHWIKQVDRVIQVQDVVGWDKSQFTESAFSSPESNKAIINALKSASVSSLSLGERPTHEWSDSSITNNCAVVFGKYDHLLGVWSAADGSTENSTAVILVTPGMLHHVGPFRLYVDLAEKLAKQGIPSLRFDISGIGESFGVGVGGRSIDRAANEISQAIDFLQEAYQIEKVILFGLCSGADDSLHAAVRDKRVVGVVPMDGCGYRTPAYYWHRFRYHHLRRMLRPGKWIDLTRKLAGAKNDEPRTLQQGDDVREFPSRDIAVKELESLIQRQARLHFVYTGGVGTYYSYAGQFFDMFPELKGKPEVSTSFHCSIDHVAYLCEDRAKLVDHIAKKIDALAN